jgi:1-acyl-sn-glycerol-3-phosphate acyltransferase
MKFISIVRKLILFVVYLISYFVCAFWLNARYSDLRTRRAAFQKNNRFWTVKALSVFKISVITKNLPPADKNFLYISNHTGMLDILCLVSVCPTLFVTSVEMKNAPLLGLLTEMGGCLYVERRSRDKILTEIVEIRDALKEGNSVTLYPEGTSTNGEGILPFKKTLMTAAAGTGVPIKPMVINFTKVNGEPMDHRWRDYVYWYGDLNFGASLFKIVSLDSIEVEIEFFEEIVVQSEEQRREVAQKAQDVILKNFQPVPPGPNEKSFYAEGALLKLG